jgi:DNA-binding LytR/AlgR family response regulator
LFNHPTKEMTLKTSVDVRTGSAGSALAVRLRRKEVLSFQGGRESVFDANAVDYLLKPFSQERFERALARAKEQIYGKLDGAQQISALLETVKLNPSFPERLPIPQNGRILLIKVERYRLD